MRQFRYASEPFDLKLFLLRCLQRVKWIFLSMLIGAVCIGGIYYLKNVTFGGRVPYVITQKYYIEYAEDPSDLEKYSCFSGYTWNDWVKSDDFTAAVLEGLSAEMTKEELIGYYEVTLPSDLRIPYIIITHEDADTATEIAACLQAQMERFGQTQKEIESIKIMDTVGPKLQIRDVRTFRAVVLGAVIGTFFALFGLAFLTIVEESVFLPEIFTCRYQIPAVGYLDRDGKASEAVGQGIAYLFDGKAQVGITAVEPDINLLCAKDLFADPERAVCVPSVLQVPEGLDILRKMQGNLLLVQAENRNGKAIESVLHLCSIHDVEITAALLVDGDRNLIQAYRFNERLKHKKEDRA